MQELFPNGFVQLFLNLGENSVDPGMDFLNLVRFKIKMYFSLACFQVFGWHLVCFPQGMTTK